MEPPMLKYTRITKLPKNFFNRDSISACLFHDKLFAFATHSGILHLTTPNFSPIRTFKCHRSSILSIQSDGEYFATASIDGTVVIGSITDQSDIIAFDFKRPVHAVVLDQSYKSTKIFISGGMAGEVIVSQRNWMGSRVDTRVDKDHGAIVGIYILDDILFWMNDNGITFYSISTKMKLLNVAFSKDSSVRPDLYWPRVHFPEVNTIIVCWGVYVWAFKVSLNTSVEKQKHLGSILTTAASSLRGIPDKKIKLEAHFKLDCLIAGIASFKDDQLLLLGLNPSPSKMEPPQLKVIDMLTGEEIHNDEVVSNNFQNLTLKDYHLGKYIGSNTPEYYLISSNDAILVKELSLKDRYTWFMDNGHYFKAWEISKFVLNEVDRLKTGLKCIEQLINDNNWTEAGNIMNLIFSSIEWNAIDDPAFKDFSIDGWQNMIGRFLETNHVDIVAPFLPQDPKLKPEIYDKVLKYYLENNNYEKFSHYLQSWPIDFYSSVEFEELLEEKCQYKEELDRKFCEFLCYLYLEEKKYMLAVNHLIKLKDPKALDILIRQNILATFMDRLLEIVLLPFNGNISEIENLSLEEVKITFSKSVQLLIQNRNSIQTNKLLHLFTPKLEPILFLYLEQLSSVEPILVAPHETKLVELYSKYEPSKLLEFLKRNTGYDIERAIEVCESKGVHYQELIYLWGKIGETKKALSLIIDKLNDPSLAISFVIDSNDSDLWEFLVSYSLDKPNFIKSLLEHRDEYGEKSLEVMKKVPAETEIDDDMKQILRNITKDNWLSLRVNKGVLKIIDDETKEVAHEFLKIRRLGKLFDKGN
ncbi:Vps41p Ecym_5534 [Eremothecium cymbalariae DBVPG|uniref:Vacuolar protein sorting-associated protein 41 n=1 Tax=Eremothecium cymbalariae (strain CBS 270.75 / DBVPG 7215 / KCTC 17166 / NRRL Y-17582) TaxID=931890 RepID=I6NDY2_ERECY|nr:hypothetical protein Ecym_5534 [Eremothecium cymbalariae DBVPG\